MSNQLYSGQGRDINVFAGQSLAVSSITGAYTATIIAGAGIGTALATDSTGGATYGPYSGGVTIRLKSGEGGLIDYEAAVSPVLNYAGPARLGYSAAGDTSSLVDGAGNLSLLGERIDPFTRSSTPSYLSKAVYYKMADGSGSSISDSLGNGPALSIGGDVSGIWANPGWLTYHSAGNPIQALGDSYIDSIMSMVGFGGSIIGSIDYWYSSIGTVTEAMLAFWRTQGASGGFRIARSGGTKVLGAYWTAPGPSTEASVTFSSDATLLDQRNNLVFELNFSNYASTGRVEVFVFRNGLEVRAGDYASVTLPVSEALGGLGIGCNFVSGSLTGKFGAGNGTGQRLSRLFLMRQEKRNPQTAQYLASWFAAGNTEIPPTIRSM